MTTPQQDNLAPLKELIAKQPWYKPFTDSLAAAIGALTNIVWLAVTLGVDVPKSVTEWGFVVIGILTVLGVYAPTSGVTSGQLKDIQNAYAGKTRQL